MSNDKKKLISIIATISFIAGMTAWSIYQLSEHPKKNTANPVKTFKETSAPPAELVTTNLLPSKEEAGESASSTLSAPVQNINASSAGEKQNVPASITTPADNEANTAPAVTAVPGQPLIANTLPTDSEIEARIRAQNDKQFVSANLFKERDAKVEIIKAGVNNMNQSQLSPETPVKIPDNQSPPQELLQKVKNKTLLMG